MRGAALFQAMLASGWTCAYAMVVWVVPAAFRNMVPFPFNLHALHLLMDTLDRIAWGVAAALAIAAVFTVARRYGERRAAWLTRVGKNPRQWWLGLSGALAIGVCAAIQRFHIYSRLDEALLSGKITYPMTPPVEEFDALLVRWQWVDLAMVAAGMVIAFSAGRTLLTPADHPPADESSK